VAIDFVALSVDVTHTVWVRDLLRTGPVWLVATFCGLACGLFGTLVKIVIAGDAAGPEDVVIGFVIGTVIWGGLAGYVIPKMRRHDQETVGPLPPEQTAAALRAAVRGPVPTDPEVVQAAERLAQDRVGDIAPEDWQTTASLGVLIVGILVAAMFFGLRLPFGAALVGFEVVLIPWTGRRLRLRRRRRLELLQRGAPDRLT
jgi:hypothetical protein